jgi:hypothetical protein
MQPKAAPPPPPPPRGWRALDENPRPNRPIDPEGTGLRAFLRKLLNLSLLDPRGGGR